MHKVIVFFCLTIFLTSCVWLNQRAIVGWTGETIELLIKMSKRKSMIHDTPLKTVEALEAPDGIDLTKKELCMCAESLYGGIMTVIANDVKDSSVKKLCKDMGRCFFKSKATDFFQKNCIDYVVGSSFKQMAKDRRTNLKRFTRARRQLSAECRKN